MLILPVVLKCLQENRKVIVEKAIRLSEKEIQEI